MKSSYTTGDEFRANPGSAQGRAQGGPVLLSENGYPTHVLLNYQDYQSLLQLGRLPNIRHDELMISFGS